MTDTDESKPETVVLDTPQQLTEDAVTAWLLKYAWLGTDDEKAREVACIMSQDAWKYIDALADKYAGAQNEPGPAAFDDGVQYALSALYECHSEPHLPTCPAVTGRVRS